MLPAAESILVVDDDERVCEVLSESLGAGGYHTLIAHDGTEALETLRRERVAVVVTDVCMPVMDGRELLAAIKRFDEDVEVVVITGVQKLDTAVELMKEGACDYIVKPFNFTQVHLAVARALEKRQLILENRNYRRQLIEERQKWRLSYVEATQRLREAHLNATRSLAFTLEAKDRHTEFHSWRVGRIARLLAQKMELEPALARDLEIAGHLHDIGKIGVPEEILLKAGPLTDEEYQQIQLHPVIAERILLPFRGFEMLRDCVKHHHERFDGRGYPDGLAGERIPFAARLIALADATDAILSTRPYRKASPPDVAYREIEKNLGSQFDPASGRALLGLFEDGSIDAVYREKRPYDRPEFLVRDASPAVGDLIGGEPVC